MQAVGGIWGAASLAALMALVTLGGCAQDEQAAAQAAEEADRPTVRASFTQALSRAPENVRIREHADGGRHLQFLGGFQHATMLVRDDAGVRSHCLGDAEEAARLVEGSVR